MSKKKGKIVRVKVEMKIMLKAKRIYFQTCRRIKAKTPFAPIFYDIRKSELTRIDNHFRLKSLVLIYTYCSFQTVHKFTEQIKDMRAGVT